MGTFIFGNHLKFRLLVKLYLRDQRLYQSPLQSL